MTGTVPPTWRIKTWDRSRGLGTITCPQLGDLPFDGHAAMVDDFVLDEAVHVELQPTGGSYRVRRIWPDDPRFVPLGPTPAAPPLRVDAATRAAVELARVPSALDFRMVRAVPDVVVEGDDDCFAYGHFVELHFTDVEYLEMPRAWGGKSFRLANDTERAYLGTRTELGEQTIAVRIVDDEDRIYFLTCAELRCKTGSFKGTVG